MKIVYRILLLLPVFLSIASSTYAQRDPGLISSRHYIGVEAGANADWLAGGSNFFWAYIYPYSDPGTTVITSLPFSNYGVGVAPQFGVTLDISLSNLFALQGKVFYRANHLSKTETVTGTCASLDNSGSGSATYQSSYDLTNTYFGGDIGLRIQFSPESWYGLAALELASLSSSTFSGYQQILASDNACKYLMLPSRNSTGKTRVDVTSLASNNFFNSTDLRVKLGIGTFFALDNKWVLTPEIAIGIPVGDVIASDIASNYAKGYPTNDPFNSSQAVATVPNLWYASLTIGLKFPFGALEKEAEPAPEPIAPEPVKSIEHAPIPEPPPAKKEIPEPKRATIQGKVTDAATGEGLDASMTVTDLSNNSTVTTTETNRNGSYQVTVPAPGKYSVTADAKDHLFGSAYVQVDADGRILGDNLNLKLNKKDNGKTRLLIFFDFGKSDLKPESYPELERAISIMKGNPTMIVEIAGYSDTVGSDEVNLELSKRRAQSVQQYLVEHGIEAKRISAKGYGKANPVQSNDTEEGRAANRRVEFVVKKS